MSTRLDVSWTAALAVALLVLAPRPGSAQAATVVTGAGAGNFADGASYNGVPLVAQRFGMGVDIAADGSASGDFQGTLLGASVVGVPASISVAGKPSSGSVGGDGRATFSGLCTVEMGDGTLPEADVPFIVRISRNTEGKATLELALGTTQLPAVAVSEGRVTIK